MRQHYRSPPWLAQDAGVADPLAILMRQRHGAYSGSLWALALTLRWRF